jgi:hypothetical protein
MVKNKPPRKKGHRISNTITVSHAPYIGRFWKDYSNEELGGMILSGGKGQRNWKFFLVIVLVVIIFTTITTIIFNFAK